MKINFNKKFKDLKGNELVNEKNMNEIIAEVLYANNRTQLSNDEKYQVYKLSIKLIACNGEIEISTEDATLIKRLCADALTVGAYGQIVDLIENNN